MQNNKIKIGDKFIYNDYIVKIININDFREPDLKYAVEVTDNQGQNIFSDIRFISEDFLLKQCIKEVAYNAK